MKRKNGFTLIELLAVIVILAVIALISTPIIIGVIDKARKGAFEDSAYGVLDAAKLYFTSKLADTNSFSRTEIDFGGDMKDFKLGGEKPEGGTLLINDDGEQALAIYDKDKKWCAVKTYVEEKIRIIDHYKKCDKEVAENLIINGYGEYGDNTNFSKFTYVEGEQAFSYISNSKDPASADGFIPIDPDNTYEISVDAKTNNGEALQYAGIMEYDIDKKKIFSYTNASVTGTLTELAQDLKNGDTIVHLKDASKWASAPTSSTYPSINRGFIFWNYKDSTGYLYPPETYSRNRYAPVFQHSNIHKDTNTITLDAPWSGGIYPAGTKLSQTTAGSDFNYSLMATKKLTSSYQKFQNQITGYVAASNIYTKFRYGARFVQFAIVNNELGPASATTTYKNIVLKKIS